MIFLYRILTFFLFPFFITIIFLRTFFFKEDKKRFVEKIFIKKNISPKNKKKIIWIHAASVGETNSVIPLINELIKRDNNVFILLTTTTLSSSLLIKNKKINSNNFQHRFFPLDIQFIVKKFLNYLNPSLVIFIDSEVWPNYLLEISNRKIPLILLNGRISMRTYNRWKMMPSLSRKLFGLYDLCLSSSQESEKNLKSLGAKNVKFIGNLKFCATLSNESKSNDLNSFFKNFYLWCAASTHPGEEEIILKSHSLIKQQGIKLVTIIIPRHIIRSKNIDKICRNLKLKSQIVEKESDILKDSEILIVNSMGEMTKYFYNCNSIFMGKSFSKKLIEVGGQNPIEPAKCGCKIYHGPYVSNFKEIYEFLNDKKIAYQVNDEIELSENLLKDFNNKLNANNVNVEELNDYGKKVLQLTTQEILNLKK